MRRRPSPNLSRRAALTGLLGSIAGAAFAEAPPSSLRPVARPGSAVAEPTRLRPEGRPSLADLVAEAGLSGIVGLALADMRTGDLIEEHRGAITQPPASVAKVVTAHYALAALGPAHRFETRITASAPVRDGVLDGDLILVGGGDPTLVTDDVAALAEVLAQGGLREVRGAFRVYGGALPYREEIEPDQLDHLGYNPSVSGLNLNFNRVHFEWARNGSGYDVTLDARSEAHRPAVRIARMSVVDRQTPIYTYRDGGGIDEWTVARRALGERGARWLPVRKPALYAGDVLRTFARARGIVLPAPERTSVIPDGPVLATHHSAPLETLARDMLNFSTNLTAEALGLAASLSRGGAVPDQAASAALMADWAGETFGTWAQFADHSGLTDTSRISAIDMARMLARPETHRVLRPILKPIPLRDEEGNRISGHPAEVHAKTGTLNFVNGLAGYVTTARGVPLAFAFFAADLPARAAGKASGDEVPAGARSYAARARRLQQVLLQRWGLSAVG